MAQEIKRIEKEFILKNLADASSIVEIHAHKLRTAMQLIEAGNDGVAFRSNPGGMIEANAGESVSVYFRFRGQPMTFTSTIVYREADKVVVAAPTAIFRDLTRNYERIVAPEGISVTMVVEGQEVKMSYPDSDTYEPVEEPSLDTGFDATKISELLVAFRERAHRYATEEKIIMFRERKPSGLEEEVVSRSGKILVLPFYESLGSIKNPFVRERIMTKEDVVGQLVASRERPLSDALAAISDRIRSLSSRNVLHEMYCPVLYQRYVVGYLYLMRAGVDTLSFEPATFEFVLQFARIFSYSLKTNGYFKAEPVRKELPAQLLNISGSGILFSYPLSGPAISLYSAVDVNLQLDDETIPVRGRVMRKYRDAGRTYMGLQFSGLEPQSRRTLFHRLYGPGYQGDVDSVGAADPDILSDDGFG